MSLAHWSRAFMQGHGKSTACVRLYTGCLEWADTNFPLYSLGFLVNRSQSLSTALACGLSSSVFPFSTLCEKKKWKGVYVGGTSPWNRTKSCLVAAAQAFWSRETPWHVGARIFTASRNARAAATTAHTNPVSGVGPLAWRGCWLQVPSACSSAGSQMGLFLQGSQSILSLSQNLSKARVDTPVHLQS